MNESVRQAAEALGRGQVVCFPTETTYGLAVDIRDRAALARLAAIKGRDASSPFGLIAPTVEVAIALAREWPAKAEALARKHWPGPLTLIVPARDDLPAEIVGPSGGVGIRVSSHPWASAIATAHGVAITATSANPAGQPPALSVAAARAYFGSDVDLYVDGGPCESVSASTVARIEPDGSVTVLRQGVLALSSHD